MTDKTDLTPASPKNWGGQMIEFIRSVSEQFLKRYTKEETDDKFLSKESAEFIYETKESSETNKNNLQNQVTELSGSKADKTYVDNTFLTKEESSSSYNAPTATKLQTAVMINGTSFDGTKNITTEAWGEPRQIQLFDSAEKNSTTVTDFDGTRNLKLILPSSAYFKDLILDGSITAKHLVITGEPETEGGEIPIVQFNTVQTTTINTSNLTSENISVTGNANLVHISCTDITASSFIKGDTIQATHSYSTSDERLKSNIKKIKLKEYYGFGPCSYNFKNEDRVSVGLIAQDVLGEFPEAVYKGKDGYLAIDYPAVIALLCGRINRLEKRLK